MKTKKSTPMDLMLRMKQNGASQGHCSPDSCQAQGCDECPICCGGEIDFKLAPIHPIRFYMPVIAICDECDAEIKCVIGRDETISHECNQGNRRHNVPKQVSWKA